MTTTLTGGCACGAVRYECRDRPIVQLVCHCRDCQKASGSAYAALLFVPGDGFGFSGAEPKYHTFTGASGREIQRGFCADCGSPVVARWPGNALYLLLQASSLDDPSIFEPSTEIWLSRAYPGHVRFPGTSKFEQGPAPEAVRDRIQAYFAARQSATQTG